MRECHADMRRTSLLVTAMFAVFSLCSCGIRAGDDVSIPANFTGWVMIRYKDPESPPLKRSWLRPMINIPPSAVASTSSSRPSGYGTDRYYFVNGNGERTLIQQDGINGCDEDKPCVQHFDYFSSPHQLTIFFVGKKREMLKFKRPDVQ